MSEIRRILVALDASPASRAAARVAAQLASRLEAELLGLFVEDVELLRLANSPLAREVDFLTRSHGDLETLSLERQLRIHAERARRTLEDIAAPLGVPWDFRVTRGRVSDEILAAADEADLVSLGHLGYSMRHSRLLGATARALIARKKRLILMLDRPVEVRAPVVVLYDTTDAARDALAIGARLAALLESTLRVVLLGEEEAPLRAELGDRLGEQQASSARVRWLRRPTPERVAHALGTQNAGVVIVPLGKPPLDEAHLEHLVAEARCPVLAVG